MECNLSGNFSKWLNIQRHGNGLGGWVAALADRLDREKTGTVSAKVECTVRGGGHPLVLHNNEISVKVLDIDDNLPSVRFEVLNKLGPKILKVYSIFNFFM